MPQQLNLTQRESEVLLRAIEGLVLFMIDVTEQVRSRSAEPERAKR
jgi:hypothetical protein